MAGFSRRLDAAWEMAHRFHQGQVRKVTGVPFVSHLLTVAGLVAEMGGTEDEVIAALLHDAAEDQGGEATIAEIRAAFGDDVANLVTACSDTFESPKPAWRKRKEDHLAVLATACEGTLRIKLADKIHNASAIVRDARTRGSLAFDSFQGGSMGTVWYFRSMLNIFRERMNSPYVEELALLVEEMERHAGGTT